MLLALISIMQDGSGRVWGLVTQLITAIGTGEISGAELWATGAGIILVAGVFEAWRRGRDWRLKRPEMVLPRETLTGLYGLGALLVTASCFALGMESISDTGIFPNHAAIVAYCWIPVIPLAWITTYLVTSCPYRQCAVTVLVIAVVLGVGLISLLMTSPQDGMTVGGALALLGLIGCTGVVT